MLPITVIPTRISSHYRADRINLNESNQIEMSSKSTSNVKIKKSRTTILFFLFLIFPFQFSLTSFHFSSAPYFSSLCLQKFQKKEAWIWRSFRNGNIKDTYAIEKPVIFPSASLARNWQFAFELNPSLLFSPQPSVETPWSVISVG